MFIHDPSPPVVAEALYRVGYWLVNSDRFEDGKHVFRSMLHGAPDDERAWIGLALCHERSGEVGKADRLLGLGRQACPRSARTALAQARFLDQTSRANEADRVFEVALELAEQASDEELVASIAAERAAR